MGLQFRCKRHVKHCGWQHGVMVTIAVRLGCNVVGWMCEMCVGSRHREVSMNCLLVSSCCARTSWFCRLRWRSAMNLGVELCIMCRTICFSTLYCGVNWR